MFKKLDRYIISKYLKTFVFTALVITLIALIIDFSEKAEDFISEPMTKYQIFVEYYLNFIFWINGLLWPLIALIAVVFFTSRMAYDSEIISIFGAGVSSNRLLFPYLTAAGIVASVLLIANHYIIPAGNKSRLNIENTYIWKHNDKGKTRDVHLFLDKTHKIFVHTYIKRDSLARGFRLEHLENNELKGFIKAKKAKWIGKTKKWKLSNYEIHEFDGMKETLKIERKGEIDTTLNLTPQDFVRFINQKEMLTTPELKEYIRQKKLRGAANTRIYDIEIYRRTADAFTIIILTVIGMSFASRKVRGGMGLHLVTGISIGALFIFLSKFSITFATSELVPTLIGVWIPNIFFSILAIYLLFKAQK